MIILSNPVLRGSLKNCKSYSLTNRDKENISTTVVLDGIQPRRFYHDRKHHSLKCD